MKMDTIVTYTEDKVLTMPVLETFVTLNGEGLDVGKPVTFVRLVGCNMRCTYGKERICDTPESLVFQGQRKKKDFKHMTAKQVAKIVKEARTKRVTLTGGEPLARVMIGQWINELSRELNHEVLIEIETNGSVDLFEQVISKVDSKTRDMIRFTVDYKSISSSMNSLMHYDSWAWLRKDDVIKGVVANHEEMRDFVAKVRLYNPRCQLILSPMFEAIEPVEIWEYIYSPEVVDLDLKFQIQLHKYVYDPAVTGV